MNNVQLQPTQPINPIDPQTIIKHGDSPTAIILAIAILLAILFQSMTELLAVILKRQK
jgi:hypothetical protein